MTQPRIINVDIHPRSHFRGFIESDKRWATLVAHRRAGKTVAVVQKLIKEALTHKRKGPPLRYGYIAPTRSQAADICWQYLKDYTAEIPGVVPNEADLKITFPNKAQIRLYSGENYERMRGLYFDGVISDEDADIPPEAFTYVILPCLLDYKGFHVRIGTPKGRNSFYKAYCRSRDSEDHYSLLLKASESGIIDEDTLAEVRAEIGEEAFQQEMECNFHVHRPGAIYAGNVDQARESGRITETVLHYEGLPVYSAFDIGAAVNTKCWLFQPVGDRINYLKSQSGGYELETPDDWAKWLKEQDYNYGGHFLPHDGEVLWRQLLENAGLKAVVVVPKRKTWIWDAINDAKQAFPRCAFHEEGTFDGIDALENYHSKEEKSGAGVMDFPVHDWSSHYSDAFSLSHQAIRAGMLIDLSTIPKRARGPAPESSWETPALRTCHIGADAIGF